ncbi:inositol monophosphatase family protein [Streptosporangium roseum]|uniref:Inositol monophosphatase n=1 Tax=Streptosporangium roseum (strain ATCC 12428 / DSM 43021 / JCM 3005 / KCTC 9067 / NCIMB 10171 / NRRL 2505 / NI 9100) TaxID=479432 RepID=D2BBW3_STRRD|nr:inositol monophosphatase family protein [Streptosporangium roseum]ACZ87986.1 inositol monophosphatase [Streptosporangium roseum DSM 43021]
MLDDLALAQRAAIAGATVGMRYFAHVQDLAWEQKVDGSVVTEADLAVEEEVRRVLLAERPADAFIGEETGELGHGRRRWILDGIDGTLVFVQDDDRWQTLIALEEDGQVVVGVAIVPAQGRLWYAARGHGAFVADLVDGQVRGERRLGVGEEPAALSSCRVGVLPPVELVPARYRAEVDRLAGAVVTADWSAHAALLVASGELDMAVQVGGKVWDYAPLSLIVTEAGGRFSGDGGQSHPVTGTAVFSSGETVHNAACEVLVAGAATV